MVIHVANYVIILDCTLKIFETTTTDLPEASVYLPTTSSSMNHALPFLFPCLEEEGQTCSPENGKQTRTHTLAGPGPPSTCHSPSPALICCESAALVYMVSNKQIQGPCRKPTESETL